MLNIVVFVIIFLSRTDNLSFKLAPNVVKMTTDVKCPEFELVPLTKFPKNIFLKNRDEDESKFRAFILSIAHVYNNFKDLTWWHYQLGKGKPVSDEINPYYGQYNGMRVQTKRLSLALLCEVLSLIKNNQSVINSWRFKEILKHLEKPIHNTWTLLEETALNQSTTNNLSKALQRIRSDGTYHYYQTKGLQVSYSSYFTSDKGEATEFAYASLGQSLESTRFYFADAAAQTQLDEVLKKHSITEIELDDLYNQLSLSFRYIVEAFLQNPTLHPPAGQK
jgi:hypothetical protein